jgi:hypothetical protein
MSAAFYGEFLGYIMSTVLGDGSDFDELSGTMGCTKRRHWSWTEAARETPLPLLPYLGCAWRSKDAESA